MHRMKSYLSLPKLGIAAVVSLPAIIALYIIWYFGVNIPFEDEWEFSSLLQASHEHHLTAAMLWEPHNEHRIFFPRLLMLGLASLSHWNLGLETFISFLLA